MLQNRYRLDAELGRGGMSVAYRAHDTLLKRPAVEVLSAAGLGTTLQNRYRLDAEGCVVTPEQAITYALEETAS